MAGKSQVQMLNRRGARTDPCGTPFLRRRNLAISGGKGEAPLAISGGKGKVAIANHLHDHVPHVSVREQSQQLAGEATVPYGVVG